MSFVFIRWLIGSFLLPTLLLLCTEPEAKESVYRTLRKGKQSRELTLLFVVELGLRSRGQDKLLFLILSKTLFFVYYRFYQYSTTLGKHSLISLALPSWIEEYRS